MTSDFKIEGFAVDPDRLPANFPTHRHEAEFWEALGRGVATFGFFEEVLGKAIFSVTATRQIPSDSDRVREMACNPGKGTLRSARGAN